MPCYKVRTMSVEFNAKHFDLLRKAIESLGWRCERVSGGLRIRTDEYDGLKVFSIDLDRSTATIEPSRQKQLNQLKQQYSKEALKRAAKLQGWQYKQQEQQKGVLRK